MKAIEHSDGAAKQTFFWYDDMEPLLLNGHMRSTYIQYNILPQAMATFPYTFKFEDRKHKKTRTTTKTKQKTQLDHESYIRILHSYKHQFL